MSKPLHEKLAEAQEILVDVIIERIKDPECPPQVYNALIKLLQQNNISAIIAIEEDDFADLRESLPEEYWNDLKEATDRSH